MLIHEDKKFPLPNPSSSPPMYPQRRYPDPFYARSLFAVIAADTGHAEEPVRAV